MENFEKTSRENFLHALIPQVLTTLGTAVSATEVEGANVVSELSQLDITVEVSALPDFTQNCEGVSIAANASSNIEFWFPLGYKAFGQLRLKLVAVYTWI